MINLIDGTAGNDVLTGAAGDDRLVGLAGDDTLDGAAGTNQIDAGDGNDTIVIDGTAVNGSVYVPATGIDGGAGTDTIRFAGAVADYHIVQVAGGWLTVTDLTNGSKTIAANVEHLLFADTEVWLVATSAALISGDLAGAVSEDGTVQASGQATISDADPGEASFAAETVLGTYGSLTLDAAGAWSYVLNNDAVAVQALTAGQVVQDVVTVHSVDGTAAQISIAVTGAADASLIIGTSVNDRLVGTKAADRIYGQDGDDRITGAAGDDRMTGGAGADRFIFAGRFGADVITDFDPTQPREALDLSHVSGASSFADLRANHLTEVGGSAVLTFGSNSITLDGVAMASLMASDFLF